MDKYKSTEAYVMNELKQAHTRIEQLENNLDEVLKKLRAAECQIRHRRRCLNTTFT